jgi:uncharacterized protein DUF6968
MGREFELGDLIAERQLTFESAAGESHQVVVRIGRPVVDHSAPHKDWFCPFQIQGLGSESVKAIFGVDAMQALLLAIHTIPAELAVYVRDAGGRFVYPGETDGSFISPCRSALEHAGDAFPPMEG